MAIVHRSGYCTHCQAQRLHVADVYRVPHLGHALATLVSCLLFGVLGLLWLPIWVTHGLLNAIPDPRQKYLCTVCGTALPPLDVLMEVVWGQHSPKRSRPPKKAAKPTEVGIPLPSPPPPPIRPTAVWGDSIPADWQPPRKEPWSQPLR